MRDDADKSVAFLNALKDTHCVVYAFGIEGAEALQQLRKWFSYESEPGGFRGAGDNFQIKVKNPDGSYESDNEDWVYLEILNILNKCTPLTFHFTR